MAYANGRLPASVLRLIPGTDEYVRADLLDQTVAMRAAFARRFGKPLGVTDGYRSYAEQVSLKKLKGFLAATPGTSNHGLGQALDLGSGVNNFGTAEHEWMKANAGRFGYHQPSWARKGGYKPEPWHWEAVAVPVSNYINVPGAVSSSPGVSAPDPINKIQEDEDVARIVQRQGSPGIFLSAPALGLHYHIPNTEELGHLISVYGNVQVLDPRTYDVLRQAALNVQGQQGIAIGARVVGTKVGDTGTLGQTVRDARVIARRMEAPIARIEDELRRVARAVITPLRIRGFYRKYLGREAEVTQQDSRTLAVVDGTSDISKQEASIQNSAEAKKFAASQKK